jgi:hypothetical protein
VPFIALPYPHHVTVETCVEWVLFSQAAMFPTSLPLLISIAAPVSFIAIEDFPVSRGDWRIWLIACLRVSERGAVGACEWFYGACVRRFCLRGGGGGSIAHGVVALPLLASPARATGAMAEPDPHTDDQPQFWRLAAYP